MMQIARQPATMPMDPAQVELPNVVSYDLDNEDNYIYAAQALDVELKETTSSPPTDEDFELALDLLRQPETPPGHHPSDYLQSPDMAFSMTPTAVPGLLSPIPTRVNSFGEQYYVNGKFVIDQRYRATNFCEEKEEQEKNRPKTPTPNNDDGRTRKFTLSDEVQLIRGILEHGKSSWKKIWEGTRELQHIKHSALKDRARSKRFCSILEQAREDPTLLDRPQELCGDENSPAYHSPMATPRSTTPRSTTPRARNGATAEPFAACGPLRRR